MKIPENFSRAHALKDLSAKGLLVREDHARERDSQQFLTRCMRSLKVINCLSPHDRVLKFKVHAKIVSQIVSRNDNGSDIHHCCLTV